MRTKEFLRKINLKSIYFNLKYFPLRTALKFPVLVSSNIRLKTVEGKVTIEGKIKKGMIKIGYGDMGLFDRKTSKGIWENSGSIVFKGQAQIGQGSKLCVGENGKLVIGDNFELTANSSIVCFLGVEFGQHCLLSWDILVMDTDFHSIVDDQEKRMNPDKPIYFGDHVWVGCRSLILKGASISSGSIIAAGTTITRKLEVENCVYGGSPAGILKEKIKWVQ